jgi:hypothetical protein
MHLTAGSTEAEDRDRERRLGSVLWAKTKPLLDLASAAQATAAVHAEVGASNSRASSAKLRDAVRAMAALRAPTLREWTGTKNRRNRHIREQIEYEINKAEKHEWMGLRKPPSEWLVGQVLDSIENQN